MAQKRRKLKSFINQVLILFLLFLSILMAGAAYNLYTFLRNNSDNNIFAEQQIDLERSKLFLTELFTKSTTKVQDIAIYMSNYEKIPERNRRFFFENYLEDLMKKETGIYGIWAVFKPYSLDRYDDDFSNFDENITGQFAVSYYKIREHILNSPANLNDYKKLNEYVSKFTSNNKLLLVAPVEDPNSDLTGNQYIVRVISPIVASGKIIGIVGIDLNFNELNNYFRIKGKDIFILDEDMNIIFSNQSKYVNSKLNEVYNSINLKTNFIKNFVVKKNYKDKDYLFDNNNKNYYSLNFLKIKESNIEFRILISYSSNTIFIKSIKGVYKILLVPVFIFIILIILVSTLLRYLSSFFKDINTNLDNLLKKNVSISFKDRKYREFKNIQSLILKNRVSIEKYVKYIDVLLQEKYSEEIEMDENDVLYSNLEKLKIKLLQARDKNIEQKELQEKEAQVSTALAKINDIQREFINDIENLAYNTIKYICDYTNAVQGGFYLLNINKTPQVLNLISFYSYNRKVYRKNEIELGDGLVGTCALEKKNIYSKVPANYLEITSGLGKQAPNYIFLLPLIHNDELYGILELAYIDDLDKHFKPFFDSSTEIIASTIATSRNTEQTVRLLEETRLITQEMQEKEKSLETQISELEQLREKSLIQEQDLSAILYSVNKIEFFAEFDLKTNVLTINDNLSEKLQVLSSDATLLNYYDIFMISDRTKHEKYWKEVLKGKSVEYEMEVYLGKYNIWFKSVLTPVYRNDEIYKVLFFGIDFSELKKREIEINNLFADLNEKAEQIRVQEIEMDDFFVEYQEMSEKIKLKDAQLKDLKHEKESVDKSIDFLQKEFQKRVSRSKRLELNLKNRIKLLEQELKNLRDKE